MASITTEQEKGGTKAREESLKFADPGLSTRPMQPSPYGSVRKNLIVGRLSSINHPGSPVGQPTYASSAELEKDSHTHV
jgi:hypothetical protein